MPDKTEQLAVFDFCETLADFQTANAFVDYVREHHPTLGVRLRHVLFVVMVKAQVVAIVNVLTRHRYSIGKLLRLRELKGLRQEVVEQLAQRFYTERVEPHLIGPVVDQMRQLQREGYTVGLSSGGYDVYLKHFVQAYGLDFCHCSTLAFRRGRCCGTLVGHDCMRDEKVRRLNAAFGSGSNAVAFSDSPSDMPLLRWAARGVAVSRAKHQPWTEQHHLQEVIWHSAPGGSAAGNNPQDQYL